MKKIPLLVVLLIISGAISSLSFDSRFINLSPALLFYFTYFLPGLVFGLAMVAYLYTAKKVSGSKLTGFVLASIGAWFIAYGILGPLTIGLVFINGLVGATVLALAAKHVQPECGPIYPTIILGGIAGFIFRQLFFKSGVTSASGLQNFILLYASFIIWQLMVGVALGVALSKSPEPSAVNPIDNASFPPVKKIVTADKIVLLGVVAVLTVVFVIVGFVANMCGTSGGC